MSKTSTCPTLNDLQAWLIGELGEIEWKQVEEHLESCDICTRLLSELDADDTFVSELRAEETVKVVPEDQEVLSSLMGRLEQLRPDHLSATTRDAARLSAKAFPAASPVDGAVNPSLSPPQQDGEIGRLGSYRVLRELGKGGMGIVYEAEDTKLGRPAALKVMRPTIASNPAAQERFLREARSMASVRHDNIVVVYQVEESNGVPWLAMEMLKGESLGDRIKHEERLSLEEVVRIGRETAEGLAAAHERGLIHRDIKPDNLWLEAPTGRIRILDFGLARPEASNVQLTQPGMIVGTPAYMSPEQGRGERADARSDLFSLGSVLYRLCTGTTPFEGKNTMAILNALSLHHPNPVHHLRKDVPRELSELIMQLLCKEQGDRPASAQEVIDRLNEIEQALNSAPTGLSTGTKGERTTVVTPANQHSTETVSWVASPSNSRWWPLPAAVLLLTLLPLGYFYGGTVIRFATNKGEIVLETDSPELQVLVKGKDGATVVDGESKKRYVLTAGEGTIKVMVKSPNGDELGFVTKHFTLRRGGKVVVNARWEVAKMKEDLGQETESSTVDNGTVIPGAIVSRPASIEGVDWFEIVPTYHRAVVTTADFHPENDYAATGDMSGEVRIWKANGKELVSVLVGHHDRIFDVAWSPDGKRLASSSVDGEVRIWEVATGKLIHRKHTKYERFGEMVEGFAHHLAWSPDNRFLAGACWSAKAKVQFVITWENETGKRLTDVLDFPEHQVHTGVWFQIAWLPDSQTIFSSGKGFAGYYCNVLKPALKRVKFETGLGQNGWAVSPDGTKLAWGTGTESIGVFDLQSGKRLSTIQRKALTNANTYLAWSPDARYLADLHYSTSRNNRADLSVWDLKNNKLHAQMKDMNTYYPEPGLKWSKSGEHVRLLVSMFAEQPGELISFNSESRARSTATVYHYNNVPTSIAFNPNGKAFACIDANCVSSNGLGPTMHLYEPESGLLGKLITVPGDILSEWHSEKWLFCYRDRPLATWLVNPHTTEVGDAIPGGVHPSPDGKTLLGYDSEKKQYQLVEPLTGKVLKQIKTDVQTSPTSYARVSADNRFLAVRVQKEAKWVWNIQDLGAGRPVEDLSAWACKIQWSPTTPQLALNYYAFSGAEVEDQVLIWDASSNKRRGEILHCPGSRGEPSWSPSGELLACGTTIGEVYVWNVESGKLLRKLRGPINHSINQIDWSPDGKVIAASFADSTVRFWELTTGQHVATIQLLKPDDNRDYSIVVSPEGHLRKTTSAEKLFRYVVKTEKGQETLTPNAFREKYDWKEDHSKVTLKAQK